MKDKKITRRQVLTSTLGTLGLFASSSAFGQAFGKACGLTPQQTEGPFYPVEDQQDKNSDLTRVDGTVFAAEGQTIYISGTVTDKGCRPVAGVLVEIWQACATGRYNHPGDRNNTNKLDPNFQYWGQTLSDANGKYLFKTILPGAYEAMPGWTRPPHVHYKAQKRGYRELTTQLYFVGSPDNAGDRILQGLSPAERKKVTVELKAVAPESGFDPSAQACTFDIVIQEV